MARRKDSGSATILVLAVTAVVGTLAGAMLAVGAVGAARQRAASGADLAALAAASTARPWRLEDACRRSATVAEANGGRLVSCRTVAGAPSGSIAEAGTGDTTNAGTPGGGAAGDASGAVDVTVAVDLGGLLGGFGPVVVRSRAGPWPPVLSTGLAELPG